MESHVRHRHRRRIGFLIPTHQIRRLASLRQNLTEYVLDDIGLGSPADRAKDILGRVYEYFLSQFAIAEGKKGGQFYTPSRVVRVLVEMLAPYKGRVYDPCCGSGGMFVSGEKFIEAHSGHPGQAGEGN